MQRVLLFVFALVATLAGARATEIPITILHTTDLHAHVWPTTDYDGNENVGGVARLATAIAKIRAETPNVLLVDAGDTVQGAPIGFLTKGRAMVKWLNYMNYDAWVLGNHEFDWGVEILRANVADAKVPVLSANIHGIAEKVQPYRLVEVGGVKVALIGLTTPGVPNWSRPRLIEGLRVEQSSDALRRVIPEVKARGAQLLVLVTHQGFREGGDDHANQINAIAREFPELELIVAGHSHRAIPEYKVNGVLYTQAGYWGTHLGRVDLVYDTLAQKVTHIAATLLPMDASVEYDRGFLREISADWDATKATLAEVIGEATAEFSPAEGGRRETPIHNLIADAILYALHQRGTDVAGVFHTILSENAALKAGPITVGDVWRIVPFENTIGVAELTLEEIREIMEESAALWQRNQFRGLMGFKIQLRPTTAVGQRVHSIAAADGSPLTDPARRYKIAFNSFDLASGGTRLLRLREICQRPTSNLREFDLQTREAVMEYIRARKRIVPETRGWWTTALSR